MKHLKLFENKLNIFTEVDFTGGSDGVYALYINGKLFKYGDYYHDKIEVWIKSFTEGAIWAGSNIKFEKIACKNDEIIEEVSELAGIPPENLSDI